MKLVTIIVSISLLTISCMTYAGEPPIRYGEVKEAPKQIGVEGGVTVTYQHSTASNTNDELLGSFDLVETIPAGKGEVVVYVEGNTTPHNNGISSVFEEANKDAGSALDRDGHGRFQVSEFNYNQPLGVNEVSAGLINPASYLDTSKVANSETDQFLGASFVNNTTIEFPDYTLGGVYHFLPKKAANQNWPDFTIVATSSHGLADNPNASYSELVDVRAHGKGAFVAGEAYGQLEIGKIKTIAWRAGVWTNTADHPKLNGSGNNASNYGLYLNADVDLDSLLPKSKLNLRTGFANESVSPAAQFYATSLETPLANHTLGVGLAQTRVSSKVNNGADMSQAEVYMRFDLRDNLHVTPSIQWIENSGLTKTSKSGGIVSLRGGYAF
jgi:porin